MKKWLLIAALPVFLATGAPAAPAGKGKGGTEAVHFTGDVALNRAFLVGFWTDDDDCSNHAELRRWRRRTGGGRDGIVGDCPECLFRSRQRL